MKKVQKTISYKLIPYVKAKPKLRQMLPNKPKKPVKAYISFKEHINAKLSRSGFIDVTNKKTKDVMKFMETHQQFNPHLFRVKNKVYLHLENII
ncbi:MAG: hypothetical protein N3E37_05885 [Candidatus Micrarchaeota archaeon]|nr:hypothetical protein [Candidatus Micrarchaeota archaeon]